jgi:hypothetical protein
MLFNSVVEHVIRRVQVDEDCLKLNGTHQLLVYAGDTNKLGRSVHTIKKRARIYVLLEHLVCTKSDYQLIH